jgi:dUTP pyrophosphatase
MQTLEIKKINQNAILPTYSTKGSAGADLYACISKPITLKAGKVISIETGLAFGIPDGHEVQIRSRSGLALKDNIFVLNSPGTIDSDYRGEIKVILANFSQNDFVINNGARIAQMVLAPYVQATFSTVEDLDKTERGEGGFGSTGI